MKKNIAAFCFMFLGHISIAQENSKLLPYAEEVFYTSGNQLNFIRLKESYRVNQSEVEDFVNALVFNTGVTKSVIQKTERDELGFTHLKLGLYQRGYEVAGKIIMAHCLNGKLISMNGDLTDLASASTDFLISEDQALTFALAKVKAEKYKWENTAEERHMREALNQPDFTYYPHGTKVVFEKNGKVYSAFRFNIYAEQPLYRANVFVNAANGQILDEQNLICTVNTPGTALTKYSGTQTLTIDQNGSTYRLRESQRGLGVETYNMMNTSTYSTTDFTNTSTSWTNTGFDQAATDAHWGAEKTYDYYFSQHNRNSINNNGFKLLSYVHYQTNYTNAFWDGQRMTYGDGNGGSFKIFTGLDVCGHEITHGLTSNTGNLNYSNESGALNESFSDIFGNSIENYARPTNWSWKIGEDITNGGAGLRSMSNPNSFGDPDTYGGTNYYTGTADNGGVHTNSGVSNYWFYLLTTGGSGTNDLSNAYSVTGLGITNAAKIAFRALTVYFTPSTNFAGARNLTIQAARDLFGTCSNEVIQTTRAWYAVGVGANYVAGVVGSNFNASTVNFCSAPASVSFSNTTLNGLSYVWNFGDGATSTATNATHTYTAPGIYSVKLKSTGCSSVVDSMTKTSYIVVNAPVSSPSVSGASGCESNTLVLSASGSSTIKWYDNQFGGTLLGTGNLFTTPLLNSTTTYYAANSITQTPVFGGILSNTGGGYLNNNAQWLIFDVLQGGVLNSVVVYAQTAGSRVIQLRSPGNVILNSTTVNLAVGANTVVLNYNLVPGTNYQLGLSSSSISSLYRTNSGVAYPYNVGGCVNITGSSAGAGAYYFFYNWKVTREECESSRIPVVATINTNPVVNVSVTSTLVCSTDDVVFTGTPGGGSLSGTGVSGNVFSPALTGAGVYTVSYTYMDANGCAGSSAVEMTVQECTGISSNGSVAGSFLVYPNPAKEELFIKTGLADVSLAITDMSGRVLINQMVASGEQKLKLEALSKGVYLLQIKDASGASLKVIKFVKD